MKQVTKPIGRPNKYDEPKKARCLWLTEIAWAWLKTKGSADYVELEARKGKGK